MKIINSNLGICGMSYSGKGTLGGLIAEKQTTFQHCLEAGKIFRDMTSLGMTPLHKTVARSVLSGEHVPDSIVLQVFREAYAALVKSNIPGVRIDGFLRNADQVDGIVKMIGGTNLKLVIRDTPVDVCHARVESAKSDRNRSSRSDADVGHQKVDADAALFPALKSAIQELLPEANILTVPGLDLGEDLKIVNDWFLAA